MVPWNGPKARVQLRLSVQRLRTLQQKKEAQAKASRRDIASLLERGKVETARIKTESIINEDIHVELLELLELYCELLIARFGLLDQNTREPDSGIAEAVCSIIYAAPRTELKELHVLRDILMHRYGREFSVGVMEGKNVSERVLRKIVTETPPADLVDAYLFEIAKGYSVAWTPPPAYTEENKVRVNPESPQTDTGGQQTSAVEGEAEKDSDSTPDEPETVGSSKVLPERAQKEETSKVDVKKAPEEDEFDALAKRFAALKKR